MVCVQMGNPQVKRANGEGAEKVRRPCAHGMAVGAENGMERWGAVGGPRNMPLERHWGICGNKTTSHIGDPRA